MFDTIAGLPLHALVVHAVVVLVPLAAALVIASVVSSTVRRRAGIFTPIFATAAFALLPIATQSGEALFGRLNEPEVAEAHTVLGKGLWPWVLVFVVLAWVYWALDRREGASSPPDDQRHGRPAGALLVVAVLTVIASVATMVQVVRVGDSGARAVWENIVSNTQPAEGED